MSEKRPREVISSSKEAPEYWLGRVFRNSFCYKGEARCVRRWSVKIQHDRRRKSFTLVSPGREEAALEAWHIYQRLLTAGWEAVLDPLHDPPSSCGSRGHETLTKRNNRGLDMVHSAEGYQSLLTSTPTLGGTHKEWQLLSDGTAQAARLQPAYWKPRLIIRKYGEWLRPQPVPEFSVRIEHKGTSQYFPLETADSNQAAIRAANIYRAVAMDGWAQANTLHSREMTVAVFWSLKPFACTYTTLFSLPGRRREAVTPGTTARRRAVLLLVEPDPAVSAALTTWLSRQSEFPAAVIRATAETWPEAMAHEQPGLFLANRDLGGISGAEVVQRVERRWPEIPAYTYGVFEDSDHIFASLSGVAAGYMMRRRPPLALLEPISGSGFRGALSPPQVRRQIRKYFRSFFEFAEVKDELSDEVLLTHREHEILDYLSKGFQDKEIAEKLGISAWTVHSHLKNIFKKYHVHTRTEAVVQYLQR